MARGREKPMTVDEAEVLAIQALSFLAGEPEELGRFLALVGIGPGSLRAAAADPRFLAGVLEVLSRERAAPPQLRRAQENIRPTLIAAARYMLDREME